MKDKRAQIKTLTGHFIPRSLSGEPYLNLVEHSPKSVFKIDGGSQRVSSNIEWNNRIFINRVAFQMNNEISKSETHISLDVEHLEDRSTISDNRELVGNRGS